MVAVLGVVAIVAAGCSSDDDGGEAPATTRAATTTTLPERGDDVALPTVTGPVTGGTYGVPMNVLPERLADEYDYVESEFFIDGTATAYAPVGPLGEDGAWTAEPAESAPYTTRILVRRPSDEDAFSGVVVVEWLNVTAGMDTDANFGQAHEEVLRSGHAWVGVSAQIGGVEGDGGLQLPIEGFDPEPLKEWDPERYGDLSHPGDDYSYDIFSQAAQAVRRPGEIDPLGGLDATLVVAAGESQSAFRLVTYVDAVHPVARIYDGFMVHSRGPSGVSLHADAAMPQVARIRTDLDVPVLQFQTETDLFGLGFHPARQPDTDVVRTWEVAGTAHADRDTLAYGAESGREWSDVAPPSFEDLCGVINSGPQTYVMRAALAALVDWAADGTVPPSAPPIEVADGAIARDEAGNALGGIRTPAVDAPVSTLSGELTPDESIICSLFGSTTPFTADELSARYPTHDDYVDAVRVSADSAVEAGFLLRVDADEIVADAEAAAVPD